MEFFCGPLHVSVRAGDAALRDKVAEALSLYNFRWTPPYRRLDLDVARSTVPAARAAGRFLQCARMSVDAVDSGLTASSMSGAGAAGRLRDTADEWSISVPAGDLTVGSLSDIEDLVGLALTTGWRRGGWVPVHAGAVVRGKRCVLLCAASGGGKTTLTLALVRRGWQAIGDDKLLLACSGQGPQVGALVHTCNLHPQTRAWFPEVGDLERLPVYSAWTDKRRVPIETVWPGGTSGGGLPTHVVQLSRGDVEGKIRVEPLAHAEILPTLLRQTVLPGDPAVTRQMLRTLAAATQGLQGLQIEVGLNAYRDDACLDILEAALE